MLLAVSKVVSLFPKVKSVQTHIYNVALGFISSYRTNDTFLKPEGANFTATNDTIRERMESRFHGFPLGVKAIAFIPSFAAFIAFVVLIIIYGRVKPTKHDPYGGRLKRIPRSKSSISMFTIVKMKLFRRKEKNSEVPVDDVGGNFKTSPPAAALGDDGGPNKASSAAPGDDAKQS